MGYRVAGRGPEGPWEGDKSRLQTDGIMFPGSRPRETITSWQVVGAAHILTGAMAGAQVAWLRFWRGQIGTRTHATLGLGFTDSITSREHPRSDGTWL